MISFLIANVCDCVVGDDKDWPEKMAKLGWGSTNKHYIFFTDVVANKYNINCFIVLISICNLNMRL